MKIRPLFGYFGGKWRDALFYPPPEYGTIVEPFAGSAGYALRYNAPRVVLCDIDPNITDLWRYLIGATQKEILALPDLAAGQRIEDLGLERGPSLLIGFWLQPGVTYPARKGSSWMALGQHRPNSFWGQAVRQSIAAQLRKIRHWEVYLGSYDSCPVEGEATWFIDPPYQTAGIKYRFGSDLIDFGALGVWCGSRLGQVVVCEQEGATWLPFQSFRSASTVHAGKVSREVIWTKESAVRQELQA